MTPTLAELIAARRNELNLSYDRIAAIADEHGLQVTAIGLQKLANADNPKEMPKPVTLRALSVALDLPLSDVLMAAARGVGLYGRDRADDDTRERRTMVWAEITEQLNHLSDDQFDQVVEFVRSAIKVVNLNDTTSHDSGSGSDRESGAVGTTGPGLGKDVGEGVGVERG